MKLIANTFTPTEFFDHLAIIFTFSPEEPDEEDIKYKEKKSMSNNQYNKRFNRSR